MAKIIWTSNALTDLGEIGEYIASDSPLYAERIVDKLYRKVEVLREHPRIGRITPEVELENVRELMDGNYRNIYQIVDANIVVLTVHHSSRNLRLGM